MQSQIRNRQTVAIEVAKFCEGGKRSSEPLLTKRYSRLLYNKHRQLFLSALNRELPPASFQRMKLPTGQWIWSPQNDSAEKLLADMGPAAAYEFITHEPPTKKPMECESKAILNGSRIKGTPRGTTERELFAEPKEPKKKAYKGTSEKEYKSTVEADPALLDIICQRITDNYYKV